MNFSMKMSPAESLKKSIFEKRGKLIKFSQKMKPIFRFMRGKQRTNAVTPSTCNYDVVECAQNDFNESELFHLHFKFHEETADNETNQETDDNARNEELEKRLQQKSESDLDVQAVGFVHSQTPTWSGPNGIYYATPVHLIQGDKLLWAPMPDRDICRSEDRPVTSYQSAERQIPVVAF